MRVNTSALVLSLALTLSLGTSARADVVYESATLGPEGQYLGYSIWGQQFLGWRFSFDEATQVTGIGGHFTAEFGELFGAIVPLPSASGLPAFPGREIESFALASTLVSGTLPSSDVLVPLSVLLDPGDYGLVFGGSDSAVGWFPFGAHGIGVMLLNNPDLPGSSYFFFNGFRWDDVRGTTNMRFVVTAVPDPEIYAMMVVGLGVLGFVARRRKKGG